MPTLPKKKIGLISCSGEDFAEGLMSRLSTLKVLEDLKPNDTVTLCLPLFLAGDEKERAFARVFPTIAIDGCSKQCAARATELYSAKPAKKVVISEYLSEHKYPALKSRRGLAEDEKRIKDEIADHIAKIVDDLLSFKPFNKINNEFGNIELLDVETDDTTNDKTTSTTCNCGLNLPTLVIEINKVKIDVIGLPIIFELFYEQNKMSGSEIIDELVEKVRLYNDIPREVEKYWRSSLENEYKLYVRSKNKGS